MYEYRLIEMVKGFGALYDQGHTRYTDKLYKKQLWSQIAKEIGISENVCKRRWYALRDQNRKNLKNGKCENWKWKEELAFLIPFYKKQARPLFQPPQTVSKIENDISVSKISPSREITQTSRVENENQTKDGDSTDAFFKGISAKVKRLSAYNRNVLESQIFSLVQKSEMSQILHTEQSIDISLTESYKTVMTKNIFECTYNNFDSE